MNRVHFSSKTNAWETPRDFFEAFDHRFHFVGDVCATPKNRKCTAFITKRRNALSVDWDKYFRPGALWMNPPYGRKIGDWIDKAKETHEKGRTVVCLLPARTDTSWWHDYIWNGEENKPWSDVEVIFVRGRLKFVGAKFAAPFPSVVVIFWGTK